MKRHRFVTSNEMPRLAKAIDAEHTPFVWYSRCLKWRPIERKFELTFEALEEWNDYLDRYLTPSSLKPQASSKDLRHNDLGHGVSWFRELQTHVV